MIKHLLLAATATCIFMNSNGQSTATFENLSLDNDTFYMNLDTLGYNFTSGDVTLFGKFTESTWGTGGQGFTYSNIFDTTQCNNCYDLKFQYSNRPGKGNNNSDNYAIAYCYEPASLILNPTPVANPIKLDEAYISNSTWGYSYANEYYDTSNQGWAKLTIKAFANQVATGDSIELYLADFRSTTPVAEQGILNDWKLVNLQPLGMADSLTFTVTSSDDIFPSYFAIDDIKTVTATSIKHTNALAVKVYPNPTKNVVNIASNEAVNVIVFDALGKAVLKAENTNQIDLSTLNAGQYFIKMTNKNNTKSATKMINKL